ncbi:acyl-CoA dehydrogenase family protein [Halofilum ochraceum]|uniref:acyl-CoA dehydrogenase family protein n=1 Tax=Halofilum ochraceum TaxID=1611323 RepID=UPI0009F19AED|nr:acyl-CoA dehydrogenase family protein [Halofilum ochraceum]
MTVVDTLDSPADHAVDGCAGDGERERLQRYAQWWHAHGEAISRDVDRVGGARLQLHDRIGRRIDRVCWSAGYRDMLLRGYAEGTVAATHETGSLLPGYRVGYVTSFFDPGLYCPHTVSLATLVALEKYGGPGTSDWIGRLTRRDGSVWQGATWMTEAAGGSDLGAGVETRADPAGDGWRLTGEKHFASNADAELALVAARPADAPTGVHGLALFAVPRLAADQSLNFRIRRLKDKIATRSVATGEIGLEGSEARPVGDPGQGIYLIMEVLNVSRVANSIASAALLQRALAETLAFARERIVFGQPLIEQPLFRRQFEDRCRRFREASALAWAAAGELDAVWQETPPYSQRYHRFRLLAHLAKYWTAEQAVAAGRWAIEAHGGNGLIVDYGIERLLREALVLSVWEGTPHRQMLDGLAVMAREGVHEDLIRWLGDPAGADRQRADIDALLARPRAEREAEVEPVFRGFAEWTASALAAAR